jgi:2-methylisocitrate lyase-like PEP mutase family enzyme
MNFKELHCQAAPVLICNVWDVVSAKLAQKLGYQAIGTSSGAIAELLGYKDGEEMTFNELVYIVQRITKSIDVPLTVDFEAGYGRDPVGIAERIERLVNLGVVGVNLEDSLN